MQIEGWKYYNHAAIPTCAPHETPNINPIEDGSIWRIGGGGTALLARWTTDWDCGYETNWWYVIKDTPLDITSLKAKRRYEITKGLKNFDVKLINPIENKTELFRVTEKAYESWPKKYRPSVNKESFEKNIADWIDKRIYVALKKQTGEICGYAYVNRRKDFSEFSMLRVIPEYEKYGINAALVYHVVNDNIDYGYINDGSRSIRHETAFQDYLEKYFGFRKAYCNLHIAYRPIIKIIVKLLYPFRNYMPSVIVGVLKMEEVMRTQ